MLTNSELIKKYNTAAPRYTSYPTVPYWNTVPPTQQQWEKLVKQTFNATNTSQGISLYLHLPFCERLCTYCGCNTRITVNHKVEEPYIKALITEWQMYLRIFGERPLIKEIHLGGGTPTFFSADNLKKLLDAIIGNGELAPAAELSFEAHPGNTTSEHLRTLYNIGFRRLSLGIQDFDPVVQDIINRVQSYQSVREVTAQARSIGYTSINYDLIYGLPMQTEEGLIATIQKVAELRPDRIAFYSYAHVPWIKPGQRKFTEADLPSGAAKRKLYETGRQLLETAGYVEIGMDHFSLVTDSLHQASVAGSLHRNFMGYTSSHTRLLVGLGASAISDAWGGFIQNEKKVEDYYRKLNEGGLPFFKGHLLSAEDKVIRRHILNIMCRLSTSWKIREEQSPGVFDALPRLQELEKDGLIILAPHQLKVTEKGRAFLRNICMAFDAQLWAKQPESVLFSQAI